MLIWLNGPFGVGKTSVARELVSRHSSLRLFDPESVGHMLRTNLPDGAAPDFQDLREWRTLVPRVASEVSNRTGHSLVAVQSVLIEEYWAELLAGLQRENLTPFTIVLDCHPDALRRRILDDEVERSAERWRLEHIDKYQLARDWLLPRADLVVDTTNLSVIEVSDLTWAWLAKSVSGSDR
ncbi:tunicamycin resistance protein [mine drainage metagenome]|uniref:Tunicamycin resistance protein n=1 Tax=mine drainage metagenome TaxID=410659 RepID=A0A1J5QES4_9ZZZZ